jgi:hypothetical protein
MGTEHWWNNNWKAKTEALGENLHQCHFVHHKSRMNQPGIEFGPKLRETRNQPLDLQPGLLVR